MPKDTIEEAIREIKNIQFAHPLVYERIEQLLTTAYNKGVEVERERSVKLWELLDEIDTLPDALHPNTLGAHECCWKLMVKTAHIRHTILQTDGYTLTPLSEEVSL